jgi:CheY-like chemotaxis protein
MTQDAHCHEVLIIDDDRDFCESLAVALTVAGFHPVATTSAFEALGKLEGGLRPCVMLIDIRMPGMNGWELWDRMRPDPRLGDTAVVVLSGDPPDARDVEEIGIRAVLEKPVAVATVLQTIERLCRLAASQT